MRNRWKPLWSTLGGEVALTPTETLQGRERADSASLRDLQAENARLKERNRALREELRRLKIEKHNDFLAWLTEPENFALMQAHRPDLMRRLNEVIEDHTPIPPSVYPGPSRPAWPDDYEKV